MNSVLVALLLILPSICYGLSVYPAVSARSGSQVYASERMSYYLNNLHLRLSQNIIYRLFVYLCLILLASSFHSLSYLNLAAVTLSAFITCGSSPCPTPGFTFDFGDNTTLSSNSSSALHTYSSAGWFNTSISVTSGSDSATSYFQLYVQPKRGCYEFQVYLLIFMITCINEGCIGVCGS